MALLTNAATFHTEMASAHLNSNANWFETVPQSLCDLLSHSLLYLESERIRSDDSTDFGQADDTLLRYIADRRSPNNWSEVMLAVRIEWNILDHNDLVI